MVMQENLFVFHFSETFEYTPKGKNNVLYMEIYRIQKLLGVQKSSEL